MVKILSVNTGSSTLKWKLFEMPSSQVIAKGMVDRLGLPGSEFEVKIGDEKLVEEVDIPTADVAVDKLVHFLQHHGVIKQLSDIKGVGHRIVAGGEKFPQSVIVTDEELQAIEALAEFAPLHNPAEAAGIRAFQHALPEALEVAVFDTSFHTTMPKENYLYSIPYDYYQKYGARKYGAHGTSHRYVAQRAAELLGKDITKLRLISLHLGSGASICAIQNGKSLDTSMGFTPLAGITMSTRSGDIDASLVAYLMEKLNITDPQDMVALLNKKSGLLGISELSPDMRDLEKTCDERPQSQLAIDIFVNRVVKYIGSYVAIMGGVDGIIFTAGIGEHDNRLRSRIIERLGFIQAKLDVKANEAASDSKNAHEAVISSPDSLVDVMVIPTNEELMISQDVMALGKF